MLQDHPLDFNDAPPAPRRRAATRMSVARLAELLNDRIAELARELLGEPNRELSSAQQLRFGTKGSVAVETTGQDKGRWFDHEAGTGGAGLELIRHRLGLGEKAARDWARKWLGEPDSGPSRKATLPAPASGSAQSEPPNGEDRAAKVAEIVRRTEPLVSTPALTYLRKRGITVAPPDDIRYRQYAFGKFGAMVASTSSI